MALSTFGRSFITKKVPGIDHILHFLPVPEHVGLPGGNALSARFFLGAFLSASSVVAKRVILIYLPLPGGGNAATPFVLSFAYAYISFRY